MFGSSDSPFPSPVPPDRLADELASLARTLAIGTARFLALLAEFDRREVWLSWGAKSTADWLSWHCGHSPVTAREHVRVARALAKLPATANEFATGSLSYSKVRALTRVARPSTESSLLALASSTTAADLEVFVRREALSRAAADPVRRHRERMVTFHFDEAGCVVLKARFAPEEGVVVLRALDAAVREMSEAGPTTGASVESPNMQGASAEAPADGADAGGEGLDDLDELNAPPVWEQERADALVHIAERFLAGGNSAVATPERALVVVHVDPASLRGGTSPRHHLSQGAPLHPDTIRRLACDGATLSVKDTPSGEVIDGRRTRVVSHRMRRVLVERDRHCRFPSCRAHRRVDAHHVKHWAHGGETSLPNLILLCRHHHRLVHEGGFTVVPDDRTGFAFARPDGVAIEPMSRSAEEARAG